MKVISAYRPFSLLGIMNLILFNSAQYNTMSKLTYGLIMLVALTMIAPLLVAAESEDDEHEENDNEGRYGEREGSDERESEDEEHEGNAFGSASNTVLYVTLAAIVAVGSYSAFKVYQAKKKATKKLV